MSGSEVVPITFSSSTTHQFSQRCYKKKFNYTPMSVNFIGLIILNILSTNAVIIISQSW